MYAQNFLVETNKPAVAYHCGEPIRFTVRMGESLREHVREISCPPIRWSLTGDDGKSASGVYQPLPGEPLVLETTLDRPGFVRLCLNVLLPDGSVDPLFEEDNIGAGAEIEKLSFHGPIPEDFDAYWQKLLQRVQEHDIRVLKNELVTENVPAWCECREIWLSTPCGRPSTGFLAIPKDGNGLLPIELTFTSYGIKPAIPVFRKDAIAFSISAHGFENQITREEMEKAHPELNNYGFDETQNLRPETTYWQNMLIRDFVAAKWIKSHERWNRKTLISAGASQGAFQAVTVAAHDPDVTFLKIFVPAFCDLHAEEYGLMKGWRPAPLPGMDYFDTVAQARLVKCPVAMSANLGDYICPPHSTVTLFNSFCTEKKLSMMQIGQHTRFMPEPEKAFVTVQDASGTPMSVTPGLYRHYKGHIYRVLTVGEHTEATEQMVLYQAENGKIWARPLSMWFDIVLYNGECVHRFTRIGD